MLHATGFALVLKTSAAHASPSSSYFINDTFLVKTSLTILDCIPLQYPLSVFPAFLFYIFFSIYILYILLVRQVYFFLFPHWKANIKIGKITVLLIAIS